MKIHHLLFFITSTIAVQAATVSTTTSQHATVTTTGVTADGEVARFATRLNPYGLDASFLVMDFGLTAASFGLTSVDDISLATITLTHQMGSYGLGKFDVFYVDNSSLSIDTGSTALIYHPAYSYGFDQFTPSPSFAGLTRVATAVVYNPTGSATIGLNLSDVESELISKINAGETIRFIISEGGDSGVSSWIGLGSDPLLAPQLTATATGIPEPTSATLSSGLVLVFCFSRRRKTNNQ